MPPEREIRDDESTARFVYTRRHIHAADGTVKGEAFIQDGGTSVCLHTGLSEEEIWQAGAQVAKERNRTLHGRADTTVDNARAPINGWNLDVVHDPPPNEHALIRGWPEEKDAIKAVAQELAARSRFLRTP